MKNPWEDGDKHQHEVSKMDAMVVEATLKTIETAIKLTSDPRFSLVVLASVLIGMAHREEPTEKQWATIREMVKDYIEKVVQ